MRRYVAIAVIAIAGLLVGTATCAGRSDGPSVAFASPADGATVRGPVVLEMRASGLRIEPAGPIHRNAGHFHVMVDRPCFDEDAFVEMRTVGFEHYGDGASTATIDLPPGRHTLCLQVGNGAHVTLAPTDEVTITVR